MYVACTKCIQVSIDRTCLELVFALSIFRQRICKSEKSDSYKHLVLNPRIPTWTSTTHLQVRKIGFADALSIMKLVRNLSGTCLETPGKLVKFCTKLHTSKIQANKKKNPIPTNRQRRSVVDARNLSGTCLETPG